VYELEQYSDDFYYKSIEKNVNQLKLIQLGLSLFNEKGKSPDILTWQFNFKFDEEKTNDLNKDKLLKSSLYLFKIKELLEKYKFENMASIIETHHISFKSLFEFLIDNNKVPIGVLRNLDGIHKFVFFST
jgi:hypothetical protein